MSDAEDEQRRERIARGLRAVREGHGANCSSIGSVIDTLFASAVVGGAVFTAIAAAIAREKITIAGPPPGATASPSAAAPPPAPASPPSPASPPAPASPPSPPPAPRS